MQVAERGFDLLDWPPQRVCSAEVPMPYAKHLEDAAIPSAERIAAAVKEMVI
jgi:pyruvate/2-oxoglutarate/acetoin dehydrogenase E1 component